jgi:hypothetical protein
MKICHAYNFIMIGACEISYDIYLFMYHILCHPLGKEMFKLRCIIRQIPASCALNRSSLLPSLYTILAPLYSDLGSGHFQKVCPFSLTPIWKSLLISSIVVAYILILLLVVFNEEDLATWWVKTSKRKCTIHANIN